MAEKLSKILVEYLREMGLEKPLLERRIVEIWPEVMGASVARLTGEIEVKNGVLTVHIKNAALRAQLFECRFELVKKLNDKVNSQVIKDIRLLG